MFRYLIIESVSPIEQNEATIIAFFSDIIHIDRIDKNKHRIILYYQGEPDVSFKDIILNFSSDTLVDFRLFESYRFKTESDRDKNMGYVMLLIKKIAIAKYAYLSEQEILSILIHELKTTDNPCFLKSYANDHMMIKSVKVYLESNQNTSVAAKQLFVHRNTLIHRIDKFINVTGFDIREFISGYLIYSLITKK